MISGVSKKLFDKIYNRDNYLIEYADSDSSRCAIYFSSSNIFYPTNDESFSAAFIMHDKYERYKTRIPNAQKHIFVRDIAKQFYIYGINSKISSFSEMVEFLKKETEGYEIVTVGSSGGGYAAVFAGILLNAKYVYCFSGFFDLTLANKEKWPILMQPESIEKFGKWYKINDVLKLKETTSKVFYFFPTKFKEDVDQYNVIKDKHNFVSFGIQNNIHGVSVGAFNLERIFLADENLLESISSTSMSQFKFTYLLNGKKKYFRCFFQCLNFNIQRICSKLKSVFKKVR